jgi:hypothetical protein
MLPVGESQPRFSVKFYIVAMLFVLFDIEVVFLYPWSIVYKDYLAAFRPIHPRFCLSFVPSSREPLATPGKKACWTGNLSPFALQFISAQLLRHDRLPEPLSAQA